MKKGNFQILKLKRRMVNSAGVLIFLMIFIASRGQSKLLNVALNANVFGSYSNAKYAVDGKLNKNYAFAEYNSERGINYYIELPKFYQIQKIVVNWHNGYAPDKFCIMIGSDIFTYQYTKEIERQVSEYELVLDKLVRGRYIKVNVPAGLDGKKEIRLSEVEVYTQFSNDKIVISDVKSRAITDTIAQVVWITNIPTTSQVSYVLTEQLHNKVFQIVRDENFDTQHNIKLSGLLRGREYNFIITSFDNAGRAASSPIYTIKLTGIPKPYWKFFRISSDTDRIKMKFRSGAPTSCTIKISDGTDTIIKEFNTKRVRRTIEIDNLLYDQNFDFYILLQSEKGEKIEKRGRFRTRGINLAKNKPVKGTFTARINDPFVNADKDFQSRLVDGSTNYFSGMAQSGSIKSGPQYFIIDLEKKYSIDNVVVKWRKLAYSQNYLIQFSVDGNNFKYIAVNQSGDSGVFARSSDGSPMLIVKSDCKGEVARYVKVYIPWLSKYYVKHPEWDFVQIFEVEVYRSNKNAGVKLSDAVIKEVEN